MTEEVKQIMFAFKELQAPNKTVFEGIHVLNSLTVLKNLQLDTSAGCFRKYVKLLKAQNSDKFNNILE